jgi:lipid-A-disaccharide synthase
LIGTPFVVVYRVSALTYAIGRRLVKVKNYGMVNLIAGREIVPELIQSNFTPENVIGRLNRLIPDGSPRAEMLRDLQDVGRMLRQVSNSKGQTAIERAARAIAETAGILSSMPES